MKNLKHFMKPKTSSKVKKTTPKKQEVLPTTVNTLFYQGLFPNGLMQVSPDYFSQSYLLGDVNYQTVGLEDKGAIVEKYSTWNNSEKVSFIPYMKMVLIPTVRNSTV